MARNLLCSPDTLCRHIGLVFRERQDTLLTASDSKIPDSTVHTLSDSLRIYFFHSGERIYFFSGFAVEFGGCVWTVAVSGKKKLRILKYRDTCGRGLRALELLKNCILHCKYFGRLKFWTRKKSDGCFFRPLFCPKIKSSEIL